MRGATHRLPGLVAHRPPGRGAARPRRPRRRAASPCSPARWSRRASATRTCPGCCSCRAARARRSPRPTEPVRLAGPGAARPPGAAAGPARHRPVDAGHPADPRWPGRGAAEQARYLTHFRADAIVRDAELLRRGAARRGQPLVGARARATAASSRSTYLSLAPRRRCDQVLVAGGLPPLDRGPDDVYRATYERVRQRYDRLVDRYPGDAARLDAVADHVAAHDVRLPVRRPAHRRRGCSRSGSGSGYSRRAGEGALPARVGAGPARTSWPTTSSPPSRRPRRSSTGRSTPCCTSRSTARARRRAWSAQRVAAEPAGVRARRAPAAADRRDGAAGAGARRPARWPRWPRRPSCSRRTTAGRRSTTSTCSPATRCRSRRSVYHDDMYVEHAFSVETAERVGNLRCWVDQRARPRRAAQRPTGSSTGCWTWPRGDGAETDAATVGHRWTRSPSCSAAAGCSAPARSACCRRCSRPASVPDVVVGTSVGAINGAAVAADPTPDAVERLRGVWLGLADSGLYAGGAAARGCGHLARTRTHVHPNEPLRALLDRAPRRRADRGPAGAVPVRGRQHRAGRRALVHHRAAGRRGARQQRRARRAAAGARSATRPSSTAAWSTPSRSSGRSPSARGPSTCCRSAAIDRPLEAPRPSRGRSRRWRSRSPAGTGSPATWPRCPPDATVHVLPTGADEPPRLRRPVVAALPRLRARCSGGSTAAHRATADYLASRARADPLMLPPVLVRRLRARRRRCSC